MDTFVINLVTNNKKGAKGRPYTIALAFVQLCQEAAVEHSPGSHWSIPTVPFVVKTILFSLNYLGIIVENQLTINA